MAGESNIARNHHLIVILTQAFLKTGRISIVVPKKANADEPSQEDSKEGIILPL